jgi:hypothetical protein
MPSLPRLDEVEKVRIMGLKRRAGYLLRKAEETDF